MTASIPMLLGARPRPLGAVRAPSGGAVAACIPLAVYLGGGALLREALRPFFTDGLSLQIWATLLAGVPALLSIAYLERRAGRDGLATVGLRGPFAGPLLRGLALYAVAFPLLALASALAARGPSSPGGEPLVLVPAFEAVGFRPVGLLALLVGVPLLEEILFRGWLQGAAAARVGPWLAIPGVAAIWTLGHAPADRPAILLLGLLLGFLYRRTGRLAACVGVHVLHNSVVTFLRLPTPGWFEWTGA